MSLERERLASPSKYAAHGINVENQSNTDRNKENKIPRVMGSISTDEEEEMEYDDGVKKYNDQNLSQRNYKYGTSKAGEENDSTLRVNQLLLKDFSQEENDQEGKTKRKSTSHPYNKNRLPSIVNVIPNKENLKDKAGNNDTNNNNNNNNSTNSYNRPFYRTSLGDWVFQETVGSGSMGKVKLAKHNYTGDLCAIKVVNRATKNFLHKQQNLPTPKDKEEVLEREKKLQKEISRDKRTIREASLGQILFHPNICKLYEMCTLSNHFYMVFEYISGGQLLDYIIQHGSLKEINARKIARSIASSLQYLHANNVVHRDLKIENVMITKNGEIKLIDFGLSNLYNKSKRLHTFCGSLYFAAPELLKAQPYIGPEIDIWSFGVILYVLVCGKVPFDDENSSVLHEKIKRGKVTYPSFLSIEIISLLTRMLVVNPEKRATLREVVNHHWMIHDNDGKIPNSYLHWRSPLTPSNIDNNVLKEMYHLEFIDDIPQTRKKIIDIIKKDEYLQLSIEHNNLYSPDNFNGNLNFDIGFDDPLMGYHPLLSIYHLVMECLERKGNTTNDGQTINKLFQDLTNEKPIETKSQPTLQSDTVQEENKTENYSKKIVATHHNNIIPSQDDRNKPTTTISKDSKIHDQPRHILIPPKLTAKSKFHTSPTRKNHFDPSDNAIPTISSINSSNKNTNEGITNHDKNMIGNLLRRFSVKVTSTHKTNEISIPLTNTNSTSQKPYMADHINSLKRNLDFQTRHTRTMSENDGTTMKIMSLLDSNSKQDRNPSNNTFNNPDHGRSNEYKTNNSDNKSEENDQYMQPNSRPSTSNLRKKNKNRTMSVGHTRRESLKFFRPAFQNNEEDVNSNAFLQSPINEETQANGRNKNNQIMRRDDIISVINNNKYLSARVLDDSEIIEEARKAPLGSMPSIDFAHSLFLRGFFSVQTTSSKPLPIVRYKIIRVLQKKDIQFKEVKGGFICIYEIPGFTDTIIKDRFSPANISDDKSIDSTKPTEDIVRTVPKNVSFDPCSSSCDPPSLNYNSESNAIHPTERVHIIDYNTNDHSSSDTCANNSDQLQVMTSGENGTGINMMERPNVKFEIHIVKVKIINLAGVHFKKVDGNTWIYKELASKILKDLRL